MRRSIKIISIALSIFLSINILSLLTVSASNLPLEYTDEEVHRHHKNDYMKIALTFDDGPHPRITPIILDILDKYGVKATFFTVGINAYYYPQTLKMIAQRGHEIGNHTFSHKVNNTGLREEIESCEKMIYEITECRTKLFRPPEGMINSGTLDVLQGLDYRIILWDIDTRDWAHTPPKTIAENVIRSVKSGDIILMHDYIGQSSPTCEALEIFIPKLMDMGYKFVVVSELIDTK